MDAAYCKGYDPDIFYPEDGHYLLAQPAKEICNFCPVQLACLDYALEHHIDDGIWGGTTRNQRRRIRRARARLRLENAS
jgi:WhiB family redox-sensing transcriptional regulator